MIGLTVDTDIAADEDLFGKYVDDLQSDITVGSTGISGTLNYIADYTSAGYTGEEASGNYLAIHAEVPDVDGVTITAEIVGGTHGPVTLDSDGILVARIKSTTQKVKFIASKTGYPNVTKTFRLNGLRLLKA